MINTNLQVKQWWFFWPTRVWTLLQCLSRVTINIVTSTLISCSAKWVLCYPPECFKWTAPSAFPKPICSHSKIHRSVLAFILGALYKYYQLWMLNESWKTGSLYKCYQLWMLNKVNFSFRNVILFYKFNFFAIFIKKFTFKLPNAR